MDKYKFWHITGWTLLKTAVIVIAVVIAWISYLIYKDLDPDGAEVVVLWITVGTLSFVLFQVWMYLWRQTDDKLYGSQKDDSVKQLVGIYEEMDSIIKSKDDQITELNQRLRHLTEQNQHHLTRLAESSYYFDISESTRGIWDRLHVLTVEMQQLRNTFMKPKTKKRRTRKRK